MEWVETTARTVEDAKEAALDQLGVDERDAEFTIVGTPRVGLFGRLRGEARVRARVRPTQPVPKVERRDSRRRRSHRSGQTGAAPAETGDRSEVPKSEAGVTRRTAVSRGTGESSRKSGEQASTRLRKRRRRTGVSPVQDGGTLKDGDSARTAPEEQGGRVGPEQQGEIVEEFLRGLLDAFEIRGEVSTVLVDEETVEVRVEEGSDIGLLIGTHGDSLQAIQEVARTAVLRHGVPHQGRVRVDIGAYRQRRREALERFCRQVALDVRASGAPKGLEPMNAADRKVVHDTVNELDGVTTMSEGEEPRRRVIIVAHTEGTRDSSPVGTANG